MSRKPDSRKSTSATSKDASRSEELSTGDGSHSAFDVAGFAGLIAATMLTARWLIPTEQAALGGSNWLAMGPFLGLAILLWRFPFARSRCVEIPFTLTDLAVSAFIGGHLLSGVMVLTSGGDRRAAANLLCEWGAVGCLWPVFRMARPWFQPIASVVIAVGVAVSLLGLWQHYWWMPHEARTYGAMLQESRELKAKSLTAPEEFDRLQTRLAELEREFATAGIPQAGSARDLFEQRLNSREPFGFFALANSLAGALLVSLLLELGGASLKGRSRMSLGLLFAAVLLLGWCLLLTKSRTGYVGMGLGVLLLLLRGFDWKNPLLWKSALGGVGITAILIAGVTYFGGLDAEVLWEAPKSLKYRLEYWHGSLLAICERPVQGWGLGGFRAAYLRFKLPESSEEISDPHNLLLDAWANGGCLALIGLAVLILRAIPLAIGISRFSKPVSTDANVSAPETDPSLRIAPFSFLAMGLGWCVIFLGLFAFEGTFDDRLWVLGPIALMWAALSMSLSGTSKPHSSDHNARLMAIVSTALSLHLLGAGGIAMPAILQLWLWLHSGTADAGRLWGALRLPSSGLRWGGIAFSLMACAGIWGFSVQPVLQSRALMQAGDNSMQQGKFEQAETYYQSARRADPWGMEPAWHFAMFEADRLQRTGQLSESSFDALKQTFEEAQRRDPGGFVILKWWGEITQRSADSTTEHALKVRLLHESRDAFQQAVARYPNNAQLLAMVSESHWKMGQHAAAVTAAQKALWQDDINRRLGHADRYLSTSVREELTHRANAPIE